MKCPHCQIPIDEHKASRCLDAWVAEVVMGWEASTPRGPMDGGYFATPNGLRTMETSSYGDGFDPSTSITAAWEVVEKIGQEFGRWSLSGGGYFIIGKRYDPEFSMQGHAETAPLAICRAALKATQEKGQPG